MKRAKLEDLFEYLPKSKIKAGDGLGEGKYPFYTSSETLSKYLNEFQHEPGCLVFGTGGKASVHLATQRFSTSTDCITVKPKSSSNIDIEYVFQYFRANMNILENGFKGAGLKHISKAYLSAIEVPHPENINDQRRIARLLGKVESLIAQRKQQQQQLDELLKSVFLEMFGDIRLKKSSHKWEPLRPYLIANSGKSSKSVVSDEMTGIPIFGGNGVNGWATVALYDNPIVIVGRVGQQCGAIHISKEPCWVTDNAIVLSIVNEKKINLVYLANAFHYAPIRDRVKQLDLPFINQSMLLDYPLPLPSIELQEKFAAIVEKVEVIKFRYQQSLTDLEALYGALSQKAFKGELDLSKITFPEKKSFKVTRSITPIVDDKFATAAQQAMSYLNQFNAGYSETLQKLQNAVSSSSILDNPAMRAIATLTEQASQWRSPFDELKNMSSVTRAFDDINKLSAASLVGSDWMRMIEGSSLLSKNIADIVPSLDMGWLKEQQAIIERATAPYASMQNAIASLGIMDNALSASYHSAITAMPDMSDYLNSMQAQLSANSWLEQEPKHIFTHYDILDVLDASGGSISSSELIQKLSELELITLDDYERIKGLIFGLLNDGAIEQRCEENRVVLSRVPV